MSDTHTTIHNIQVLVCAPDGKKLNSERDALDLIGDAMAWNFQIVKELRTGILMASL